MKRPIIDLDETITLSAPDGDDKALPERALIARLRAYRARGFEPLAAEKAGA